METPDVTPIQSSAVIGLLSTLFAAHAAGLDGTDFRVLVVCLTALACVVVAADAVIRHGRAGIVANRALVADLHTDEPVDEHGEGASVHPFPTPEPSA